MESRAKYLEALSAQIAAWDNELAQLRVKAQYAPVQDQLACREEIEALELKRQQASILLEKGVVSAQESWESYKEEVDRRRAELGLTHGSISKDKKR